MKNNYRIIDDIVEIEIKRKNGEIYYCIIDSDEFDYMMNTKHTIKHLGLKTSAEQLIKDLLSIAIMKINS